MTASTPFFLHKALHDNVGYIDSTAAVVLDVHCTLSKRLLSGTKCIEALKAPLKAYVDVLKSASGV